MKNPIRKALRKTVRIRGKMVVEEASDWLVYGTSFAIIALLSLTVLEAVHMIVLRSFSNEIFAAISLVVGTILGVFFGKKA